MILVRIFIGVAFIGSIDTRNQYVGRVYYRTDSGLVEVPSDIPLEAIEVHLEDNKITELKTGTFSHLTGCIKLDIQNNYIETIEDDAFTGMARLENLVLVHNKLKSLEKSMFNGLTSLTILNLERNLIESIQDGCFSDLRRLNNLYLGANKLPEISRNMWQGLNVLKKLYLNANNIATLKSGDISHLPQLEVLLLFYNPLITLSHTIFNPQDYPETDGHPRYIQLGLALMKCNSSLCWLKQGERTGWITWHVGSGKSFHPDCINLPDLWHDVDLNCPSDVECSTYIEPQCQTKCESIGPLVGKFNVDSTCPCKCSCPDFVQSDCESKCQEEGKVVRLGSPDQFGCLRCNCICPPYLNTSCQNQCDQEGKIHIAGARSRYGCEICQCGCLSRDCDTECGDLEFRVATGSHGCIVGCQCICADGCEPNCHGCIKKGVPDHSSDEPDDEKISTANIALIVVGSLIGVIMLGSLAAFLCLKKKGLTVIVGKRSEQNQIPVNNTATEQNIEPPQYEKINTGHLDE